MNWFRSILLSWQKDNFREFPWRNISDPYSILIAEMMLQRTRADQVTAVYNIFIKEFPTPHQLSSAEQQRIKDVLHPLGLAWRVPNFKSVADVLINNYNGRVPKSRAKLLELPGIGEYIAGAILTCAFNKKEWIVDSNIVRIYKRFYGMKTSKEGRRDKNIRILAKLFAKSTKPRASSYAILDFTALVCKPNNPTCLNCALRRKCYWFCHT